MLRIFNEELLNPKNFVVTLELVPSRALQLARMGIKNILALTGD